MSDITDQEVLDALASNERDIVNAYRRGWEDCQAKHLILETDKICFTRDEAKRMRHALECDEIAAEADVLIALLDERIKDTKPNAPPKDPSNRSH
jgi:hypothetical protein